jgi:hypothetical protein
MKHEGIEAIWIKVGHGICLQWIEESYDKISYIISHRNFIQCLYE